MNYRVEVESRAARQFRSLPPRARDRVLDALDHLREDPRPGSCLKLKGKGEPAWRMRVGDYRILYRIHDAEHLIRVYGIVRRDEAYR